MEIIFTIAAFLLLIGIVVTIHEGGHFVIGRMCGIKMLEFSIGFGPKVFSKRFGKDNTLFTLRAFPLGGFVKPFDKSTVSEEDWENSTEEDKKRTFTIAARWKKTLMVLGGPVSNFILAFFIYLIAMTMVGTKGFEPIIAGISPTSVFANSELKVGDKITEINHNKVKLIGDAYPALVNGMIQGKEILVTTENNKNILINFNNVSLKNIEKNPVEALGLYFKGNVGDVSVTNVIKDSPAYLAGLKEKDVIVSVNNMKFHNLGRTIEFINQNPGKELSFEITRDGKTENLFITPEQVKVDDKDIGRIGVVFELINSPDIEVIHYGFKEAMWNSTVKVWDSTYTTLISIKKLIFGELSVKSISGPVAIADFSGKSAQLGLFQYMMMIAAISIAVGVFNLLPIPALDGGHLAQYGIEWVLGHDMSPKVLHYGQITGFGIIMGIFSLSIFNDIIKYVF